MYRPLSPHLFIYKPQLHSVFSVAHRATGVALSMVFIFVLGIAFCFRSPFYMTYLISYNINTYLSWLDAAIFYILVLSFVYHVFGGIRRLLWDFYFSQ